MKKTTIFVGFALTVLLGAGCSFSVGGEKVTQPDELETIISAELAKIAGFPPDVVECTTALAAEKGATGTCTLTQNGVTYEIALTSNGVGEDGMNQIDFKVANEPLN